MRAHPSGTLSRQEADSSESHRIAIVCHKSPVSIMAMFQEED
jgi:hypothetical protein